VIDSASRPDILFLCHRIPFPPDKGDKIRSYRWLKALSSEYHVHLVAFVDDVDDWRHRDRVQSLCRTCRLVSLSRTWGTLRSARGLGTGSALTLPYYQDRQVGLWLAELMRGYPIEMVFVYSAAMAPYVLGGDWERMRRVIDFVDVDSDKWRQYAAGCRGLMRWLYRREAERLERFEGLVSRRFDLSLLVSDPEMALFERSQEGTAGRLGSVSNGVDDEYFSPDPSRRSPYAAGGPVVVFTGAMDYWANVDAVCWFVAEVWPLVLTVQGDARFVVVGSKPAKEVKALAGDAVTVTGRVADVRPYLQYADAVVAPLRVARGIQNKVLEGMAMGRPMVVTGKALEGIDAVAGQHVLVGDSAMEFAARVLDVLTGASGRLGEAGQTLVSERYSWDRHSERFLGFVRGIA
jgi:sugar transferase (PEP-CTERM/EpsH1 system associated)